jgi:hypothetical protein
MIKLIACKIRGHNWVEVKSTEVYPTPYERFVVVIEVCKRCGRLRCAEEIFINYREGIFGNILVAHKDLYNARPDRKVRLVVG